MKEIVKSVIPKHGQRKNLMKRFDCSASLVSQALNFQSNSNVARQVRSHALNFYGATFYIG